jgi:hypothetical protein
MPAYEKPPAWPGDVYLYLQKPNIFIRCGSANTAYPCQFAQIQLSLLVGWIVPEKASWNILYSGLTILAPLDLAFAL